MLFLGLFSNLHAASFSVNLPKEVCSPLMQILACQSLRILLISPRTFVGRREDDDLLLVSWPSQHESQIRGV
jgi:hypothetical protein